ncbi:lipocalin family protein [Aureitalea sp. L0-47]|uniref:lipocalin family protein n=1 Tax=Aureitalea sp. L0-47 TaxID=2816962 RepID=UPI002238D684|nr:lipocalin family protein [Aureitalea sp. L0-47]MCW5521009.1 lipocalin family protein [Aureitalea sp. L0-47]
MKKLLVLIVLSFLLSCGQNPEEMKTKLAGYWVIEKVEMPDGAERQFQMSNTIDFIELTGDSGVRKKVQPRLDGGFTTSESAERFKLKIENDSLNVYYTTPYDNWKESVLEARDSLLVVRNKDGKIYTYAKFKGFSLSE